LERLIDEQQFPAFEKNELTTQLNMPSHLPFYGDGELLSRVFENLPTNAIRYGTDGRFIEINSRLEAGEAIAQVVNYGECIPEKELPRLFDAFYTGDRARSHQGGRSGLGPFIAKNIVEQHRGKISVQSSPIRTVFEVRLPAGVENI
jgi:signal transduction histidine kinase